MASRRGTPKSPGRHRSGRRHVVVKAASLVVVLGTVVLGATSLAHGERSPGARCPALRNLEVAVAPGIAAPVRTVVEASPALRCVRVHVTSVGPSVVAAGFRGGARPVDVWVPDSSVWLAALPRGARLAAKTPRSIARSPVVLAVPAQAGNQSGTVGYMRVVYAAATAQGPVLQAASPVSSATSQAALLDLDASLGRSLEGRGHLAAMFRSMQTGTTHGQVSDALPGAPGLGGGRDVVRATTERAVWAANQSSDRLVYRAVYPPAPGLAMDYPYVTLATTPASRRDANTLLKALTSVGGRATLESLGFRPASGRAVPALTPRSGVQPSAGGSAHALTSSASRRILRVLALLNRPSRVLALVDVSGSMAQAVPGGAEVTRMALVRQVIEGALPLFPADSVAGLWRFSSALTPSTDFQQLAALRPLTPGNRGRLAEAVDKLRVVREGGTGLYGSVLAAVRRVRSTYDPTRINSVVVLSDGKDEDGAHDIDLESLLAALHAENDSRRPVVVISIAYGPDSDSAAMRAISEETGGTLYTAKDPRDLPVIFREAIGHRLCAPGC
jgi:Ca-activated chloride channel homolog